MPSIPEREDLPAVSDEDIFAECNDRLRIAIEAENENRAKAIEALSFRDGAQWPDDLYNQRKISRQPSLTINHTNTFCRRVVNNMRQQRPRIKVHPVGDGADIDKAQIIEGLIRHIETRSNAGVAYDTGGESAVNIGWGYWRIIDEFVDEQSMDQELRILPIRNTFTVYMDPSSVMPAGEDMEWCIITEKMKRSEYRRQYPKAENVEFMRTGTGDNQTMWESKTEIRLAEYYRITRKTEKLYELTNQAGQVTTSLAKDYNKLKADYAAAGYTVTDERPSFRRVVEWFKVNGRKIVDRRSIDSDPLPDRWIPIIRCEGNVLDLNGKVRRKGMVEDLMDPARMYNYWRTAETIQLALASKAPWIGQSEHFDGHPEWNDANQQPYSKLTYNAAYIEQPDGSKTPLPPPQRQPAIEVPAGFVQAAQGAQQDLMAVAGMPHEPGQDSPGAVVSGIALQRRQALSDIGHFQYYDNQTRAISHTGTVCLDMLRTRYSTKRMQRIIGEDGVPQMAAINTPQPSADDPNVMEIKNDMTVGQYSIVMDTGPGYESKRIEGTEAVIDLMKTELGKKVAEVGGDIVLRNMDFNGASDLADRMMPVTPDGMKKAMEGLPKQAQSIVNAMLSQMTALQNKLKETEDELKHKTSIELGWMNVEKDKIQAKAKVDAANNDTKRFDTHVKAVTARDVAEIHAGTQLLNTEQEARHESVARRETLAAATKAETEPV